MGGLIATPSSSGGWSDPMTVAGRKGRFNWNITPQYDSGIGSGRSPMHAFETQEGELFFHRLESDLQGGRWEESAESEKDWEDMQKNPEVIREHWGESPITDALMQALMDGMDFKSLKKLLKPYNTWRQISGD
jgi:hypothetical protein